MGEIDRAPAVGSGGGTCQAARESNCQQELTGTAVVYRQCLFKERIVSINERIEQQLSEFPVLLYMKGTPDFPQCGFSAQVVGALKQCQKRFAFVNILEDAELRQGLKDYSEWPTFPQLWINGELVGGCDIISEMHTAGELKTMIDQAIPDEAAQ